MSRRAVRLRVTGLVQGVGYREWTMRKARSLGLDGWVRNRVDGSVEVIVAGSDAAVAAMVEACQTGPAAADVAHVGATDWTQPVAAGFEVLQTA